MNESSVIGDRLESFQRAALMVGAATLAVSIVAGVFDPPLFFRAYLLAFVFWSGIPLGCLVVLMMHHVVGGGWGFLIRRPLEAGMKTLPIVAILAVPLLLGIPDLYSWSHPDIVALDRLLQHKRVYLNAPFFVVRAVVYFAVWIALSHFLSRWADEQDRAGSPAIARRLYALSGPGIILYALTVTLASLDWVMSLEPDWFSTIYSAVFMVGQVLSALAFLLVILAALAPREPLLEVASPRYLNDLGNLLLAFVMLWAYMAFSQFLIIWSGNLGDEIDWYLHRLQHGWQWVASLLLACHFAVPFLLLLSRNIKRNVRSLAALAAVLLLMRLVDVWWDVDPAFYPTAVRIHWMDALTTAGIGGLWIAGFVRKLKQRPLLPLHDPELSGILARAAEGVV